MPTTFDWAIDRSGLPALPDESDPPTAEYVAAVLERNAAENTAVAIMWALSGRQFGLHTQTMRPCAPRGWSRQRDTYLSTGYVVTWEIDRYQTWPCGCEGGRCALSGPRAVHLPGPVYDVTQVQIADAVLDPADWAIEGNVLYRRAVSTPAQHSSPAWPNQDLARPLPEVNTWSVTYRRGIPVPDYVAALTGVLAKEIYDALNDEGRCRLPRTVTTVSRNGVTYRAYDPAVIYANGKTGIPEIDLWLATVNPHALMASPSVI